ncbi:glycosyltransferase [Sinorhizobium meliloti]|uniref:glycosyltransferase n=1 Tax=Rhizobium meliloti TaxID=382 RepID=UPI000FD393CF|nr:glycosyltransferase [Sinorhizobium meliloti]MDE3784895.1 glycosyltransferase [Sinorhizobium meliloti]RVI11105.1 glycosyltransferase [Sinorhizobium meliloti]
MKISIIVPLRLSETLFEGLPRLEKLLQNAPADRFEVVVVDYGSPPKAAAELVTLTAGFNHAKLVRVDADAEPFSAGVARNIGAQNATSPVIMFNDVDCLASPNMYEKIHKEARARRIDVNAYDFFAIPIAFLTFEGVEEYQKIHATNEPYNADSLFHYHIIRGEKQFIWFMAYSGSTIVVNRLHYLSIGGTSPVFHGHGAEDYEVKLRLAAYRPVGRKPLDYYRNTKNNQMHDYVGFRSYLSLYAYEVAFRGIYMVHLWHPRREVKSVNQPANAISYKQTERNFTLLGEMMKDFDNTGKQPGALADRTADRKTLVLCRPASTALETLRQALPLLGQYSVIDETVFADEHAFLDAIEMEGFTHVFFLNPYGNEHRLNLYNAARRKNIPYWVHDRGALPHSWFFDPNGFNADSSSYHRDRWDKPLTDDEREDVTSYIMSLKANAETLEKNGAPKSPEHWRHAFGIGDRKVLFVPLQRPNDTVTRYFGAEVGPYENFFNWVAEVAAKLDPSQWAVVVKKHPAELNRPNIPGVVFAPDDAHIHDLIDLSHSVMLLNSGVGLLSLAFGKPVIACGEAFYATEGLASTARSVDEAVAKIGAGLPYDRESAFRFIHYLTTKLYSFGETIYIERDNGYEKFLAASRIRYKSIRMLSDEPVLFGSVPAEASLDSPLYSSFGGKDALDRARLKVSAQPAQVGGKSASVISSPSAARLPVLRRPLVPIVRPFIRLLGNAKDMEKYNRDPVTYFRKLKNPAYRWVGGVLFPFHAPTREAAE